MTAAIRYCYGHADARGKIGRVRVSGLYFGCARCKKRIPTPQRVAKYIASLKAQIARMRHGWKRPVLHKKRATSIANPFHRKRLPCAGRDLYGGKNPRRCPHCGRSHGPRTMQRVKRSPAGKAKRT